MIGIREATLADLRAVAGAMRESDRKRCMDIAGLSPMASLMRCWRKSSRRRFASVDGQPAALWGVKAESLIGGTAAAWLVITRHAEKVPVSLVRLARSELREIASIYPEIVDMAPIDDPRLLKFVRALGFKIGPDRIEVGDLGSFYLCKLEAI